MEHNIERLKSDLYYDLLDKYSELKEKNKQLNVQYKKVGMELLAYKIAGSPENINLTSVYNKGINRCIRIALNAKARLNDNYKYLSDEIQGIVGEFLDLLIKKDGSKNKETASTCSNSNL